jgi:hypothetical protein
MDYSVPQFLTYVVAWFATIGGIWALFDRAETVVHPKIRGRLSDWLTAKTPIQIEDWPGMFASVFDRVFGKKHISWRCFRRSAIVSVISVGIMSLVVTAVHGAGQGVWDILSDAPLANAILFAAYVVLLNLLPDYVSLLETRLLIRFMSAARILIHPLFLILDAAFTTLIFGIAVWLTAWMLSSLTSGEPLELSELPSLIAGAATFWNDDAYAVSGIFLYSTFVTSAWIWLFVVSGLVVRSLSAIGLAIRKLGKIFDVEEKPLRSIGFVSMVLVTAAFVLLPFIW